jgi:hypothetical protein
MNGAMTATRSRTDTFTEARLAAVMPEVGADFYAMASAGLITLATAQSWTEELTFILKHRAAQRFQIQLHCPDRATIALDYQVRSDGTVHESGTGGGIDYFALPAGTYAGLLVTLDDKAPYAATVRAYIVQRGWGTDGQAVPGDPVRDRAYSKDGYGVVRGKVGNWP